MGGIVSIAALYCVFVLTSWGQRFDDAAKLYSTLHHLGRHFGENRMFSMRHWSKLLVLGSSSAMLVAIALWRRQHAVFTTVRDLVVTVVPPVVFAELLKVVLPHPRHSPVPAWIGGATFASGHTAYVVAASIVVVRFATPRFRNLAIAFHAVSTMTVMTAVVLLARHRPSDAIASAMAATIWGAVVHGLVVEPTRLNIDASAARFGRGKTSMHAGLGVLLGASGLGLAAVSSPARFPPPTATLNRAFVAAMLLMAATTVATTFIALRFAKPELSPRPPFRSCSAT